jgi:hypothetical protein
LKVGPKPDPPSPDIVPLTESISMKAPILWHR